MRLPRNGRRGRLPRWPFADQTEREKVLWRRLWKTPAAVAWEQLGWQDVVARYGRTLARAEGLAADPAVLSEARQLEDRLGLSPMAMARLRWVIAEEEGEEEIAAAVDVRERLKVVSG